MEGYFAACKEYCFVCNSAKWLGRMELQKTSVGEKVEWQKGGMAEKNKEIGVRK